MNINLSKATAAASKKKKQSGSAGGGKTKKNVFGVAGGSSSSEEEEAVIRSGRDAINLAIAREQEALRARTAEVVAQDAGIFDYDGAYDSFAHHREETKKKDEITHSDGKEKKSRYIGDLLKAADKRKQERDFVYERKMARELAAEEEADPEMRDKERFVTAAYKRKLEERKLWEAREEEQRKVEEKDDVTKRMEGMADFYGNLNRNMASGGTI